LSAFAVVYDRSNTPGESGVFNRIMERLSHRGPDGSNVLSAGGVTLGYWRFWMTPEEAGEQQPLALDGAPFMIVFDGRIDNRADILAKLNIHIASEKSLSDAALMLRLYARWGADCFQYVIGEFALAVYDEQKHELICARDHLGDRTLFYAVYGNQVVVASEPWAVAAARGSHPALNERAIAHYFAVQVTEDGQTFFDDIYELLPAHAIKFNANGQHTRRYWQPDLERRIRYKTDAEYAEHFRSLLEETVRNQLRSITPVGILMSGGLDSTSVASLAARMIAPRQLTAISYVFDEFPDCDERAYINTVKEKYNLRSIQIPSDHALPYADMQSYVPNPNEPNENLYRQIHETAFTRACAEGLRVVLHGGFGDNLYIAGRYWLADLLLDGQFATAWRELCAYIQTYGVKRVIEARHPQRIARRLVDTIPGGKYVYRKSPKPQWLTQHAQELLPPVRRPHPTLERHAAMLGLLPASANSHFFFKASQYGVELRTPFRDRRLVEFALGLPAYQIYHHGFNKYILRSALKDILPDKIAVQIKHVSLLPFLSQGLKQEASFLENQLESPHAAWQQYVNYEWLRQRWNMEISPEQDGPETLIFWLSLSFEKWQKSFSAN
jgi:asparagine synthase (glutamine-hydrolysing)